MTDAFFTPEVLAELDKAVAEAVSDPKRYSMEEVELYFAEKSAAWKLARSYASALPPTTDSR
jgi:hypothetical protein